MSTAGETSSTVTEPVSSSAALVATTESSEINDEAVLDAALAAEQQKLDRLAQQQRVQTKRQNLERLRAECEKLQHLHVQTSENPTTSVPGISFANTSATVLAQGGAHTNVMTSGVNGLISSTQATTNSLRQLRDVQDNVNALMKANGLADATEKRRKNPRHQQHIESSTSDADGGSSSDDSQFDQDQHQGRSRTRRHKSGKSKKLTSNVPFPQRWPETYLKLHYVGKQKDHENLTIAEFCAGFTSIIQKTKCQLEKDARINLLRDLMYFATIYPWSNVLAFHGACLMEIEQGVLKWGSDFHHLIHTTLLMPSRNARSSNRNRGGSTTGGGGAPGGGAVRFCPKYQRNQCSYNGDHEGTLRNQNCNMRHICAKCWLDNKSFAEHPETSPSCPLNAATTPAAPAVDVDAEG